MLCLARVCALTAAVRCAGSPNYDGTPALTTAQVVTLGAPNEAVTSRSVGAMTYARGYACSMALPDGNVLTIGGQPLPMTFNDDDAILVPGAAASGLCCAACGGRACWEDMHAAIAPGAARAVLLPP